MAKTKKLKQTGDDQIIINEEEGLVFATEEELFTHFQPHVEAIEEECKALCEEFNAEIEELEAFEPFLERTLNQPEEIWWDDEGIEGATPFHYLSIFEDEAGKLYYVAVAYRTGNTASFIYLHFATRSEALFEYYKRGELVFSRDLEELSFAAIEGDALSEGDVLAVGLFKAMLKLRSEEDLDEDDYKKYRALREPSIEEPDEIWRSTDLDGNVLVNFIRDFPDEGEKDLHYIVVTQQDGDSSVHALLFSFPTTDKNLIERYRRGDNLQAEEVTQESSH